MTSVDAVIEKSKLEAGDDALEYLLQLERKKYELLKKSGFVDFEAMRNKLHALEAEVAHIDQQNLTQINVFGGHSQSNTSVFTTYAIYIAKLRELMHDFGQVAIGYLIAIRNIRYRCQILRGWHHRQVHQHS